MKMGFLVIDQDFGCFGKIRCIPPSLKRVNDKRGIAYDIQMLNENSMSCLIFRGPGKLCQQLFFLKNYRLHQNQMSIYNTKNIDQSTGWLLTIAMTIWIDSFYRLRNAQH